MITTSYVEQEFLSCQQIVIHLPDPENESRLWLSVFTWTFSSDTENECYAML